MMEVREIICTSLWELQDQSYREFHAKLIPAVSKESIIGVQIPKLRKLARSLLQRSDLQNFLNTLPHTYYEENNLHGLLIAELTDFDQCIAELDRFLPYVDNWATCDSLRPKCLGNEPDKLLAKIKSWLLSDKTYTIRFGLEMLMVWFLDKNFIPEHLELAASLKREEYYVKMMQAWYFATALTKHYDVTLRYLEDRKLSCWVHNKTIQKAIESFCITLEQKTYLRTLKRTETV